MLRTPSIVCALSLVCALGCSSPSDSKSEHRAGTTDSPAASTAASSPASSASAAAGASGTGAPSAKASSAPATGPERAFRGTFKAKKRKVTPQSTAEDDAWKRDDGKSASGPGDLELTMSGNEWKGFVRGPWGALEVHGESTDEGFAATLRSSEASGPHGGFDGIMTGKRAGDGFDVSLRVSSGDSQLARDGEGHVAEVR